MPIISPLITSPITRPSCPGGAIEAATGTSTWMQEQAAPSTNSTASSEAADGANDATAAASAAAHSMRSASTRFSTRSDNGTRKNSPAA